MPSSTNPHTYRQEEWELLYQATKTSLTIEYSTKAKAIADRHRIYGLRKALWRTYEKKTDPLVFYKREVVAIPPHPLFKDIPVTQQVQVRLEGNTLCVGLMLPPTESTNAILTAIAKTGIPTYREQQMEEIVRGMQAPGEMPSVTTPAVVTTAEDNDPASDTIRNRSWVAKPKEEKTDEEGK